MPAAQFFRVAATAAPALPVQILVGALGGAGLAAACVSPGTGGDAGGGYGCAFEYDPNLTPTLEAVEGMARGRAGLPIVLRGSGFGKLATVVSVGIGGSKCDVSWANVTHVVCALDPTTATAGTFPVVVDVDGLGLARHVNSFGVNYTISLEIDSVLPLNGSRVGGTEITISGSGFARLGPMQRVVVDGVPCVPKTQKNLACRVSEYDSGQPCAWTAGDDAGYAMAASPYAEFYDSRAAAQLRYYAEWYDFSTTTRIVCVLEDLLRDSVKSEGRFGEVNVTLPGLAQLVDNPSRTVEQDLPSLIVQQLEMATRDLFCVTLLGYRMWNVAYDGGDCVLWNDKYNDEGTFGDHLVFNGSTATFGGRDSSSSSSFVFLSELTPVVYHVTPTSGSPGQIMTIVGHGFEPRWKVSDTNWYIDEFGFYTQPEPVTVYVGDNPTVITHKNDTHIEALVIYNTAEVAWDVRVWVHGKGLAAGNATFTYALYVYDISPPAGSVLGGTPVTITGSGFASTYMFYSDESSNDMGSSLASYDVVFGGTDGTGGVRCTVTKASSSSLECTTKDPTAASTDIALDSQSLESFVEVSWNFEPFHFYCGKPPSECTPPGCRIDQTKNYTRACNFAFEQASTPRLELQATHAALGPLNKVVVAGDTLSFSLLDACTATECLTPALQASGDVLQNFNWTAWEEQYGGESSTASLAVDLPGNVSCSPVFLDISSRTLSCPVDKFAVPQGDSIMTARVWLDGVGYAATYGNATFTLRPTVTSIAVRRGRAAMADDGDGETWRSGKAAQSGSMGGGLKLTIRGRGFAREYLNYVRIAEFDVSGTMYYGYCANVVVVNDTMITCITPAVSYESSALVTVVVNGTTSACEKAGTTDACRFRYTWNTTDTPRISDLFPRTGTYDDDAPQLVKVVGEGFLPGNTTVTLGSADCKVVRENTTHIACNLPRHAGGVYEVLYVHEIEPSVVYLCSHDARCLACHQVMVSVAGKGLATGERMWFTFGVELRTVSPREGSTLAGTEMTFSGRGFAACTPTEDALGVFGGGVLAPPPCIPETVDGAALHNYFKAYDGAYFDAIVVRANFYEIVAVSTVVGNSNCHASSSACDMATPAVLRVGIGYADSGPVSGSGTAWASSYYSKYYPSNAFDGSSATSWDAYASDAACVADLSN